MASLYELCGREPFERYEETAGRKRDWRVCFMDRGPDGAVTIEWEGFEGTRQRARYWEERSERWSVTGRTDASA